MRSVCMWLLFCICGSVGILVWWFEHMLLLVECIRYVWFVWKEVHCFNQRGRYMFFFVSLYRPYIPCNSQDDFHRRGHVGHHWTFVFTCIGSSCGHLCIWRISVWDGNNFWCAHIFDSLHIEQYPYCVWAVQMLFCADLCILHWIYLCYLGQVLVLQKKHLEM
jgi:hypothetical protein